MDPPKPSSFIYLPANKESLTRIESKINSKPSPSMFEKDDDGNAIFFSAETSPNEDRTPPTAPEQRERKQRQAQVDALTLAISRVLTPVMICMALAVWFVHSLGDPRVCRKLGKGRVLGEITLDAEDAESSVASTPQIVYSSSMAAIFIGIFVVLMVVFTFVLVCLYKMGKTRIIMGWLIMAVALIFGYVGGVYIFDFCRSRCISLDWISFVLAVWNFTVTGLIAVFGVAPRLINQGYLIVMSSLMAYIFRTLPSWAIWTILGALVVWDLFAVLSPCGPLKMLVKIAKERGDPLPALVYDTNPEEIGRDDEARAAITLSRKRKKKALLSSGTTREEGSGSRTEPGEFGTGEGVESYESGNGTHTAAVRRRKPPNGENEGENLGTMVSNPGGAESSAREDNADNEETKIGTLGTHLKLGLGDFVFYSILVAQASQEGAMTTVASFVAILAGLSATLFLVTVYRTALPALPISICAGLIFHFLTRYTVQPLLEALLPELLFF